MFKAQFKSFVCEGDSITCDVDGFTATATLYRDDCGDAPDDRQDGFWPSLDPKAAGYIGAKSQRTLARHMAKAQALMDAWQRGEWHYFGVAVTIERAGVQLTERYAHAVWGIEGNYPGGDNSYFQEVANELLEEALAEARAKRERLCA